MNGKFSFRQDGPGKQVVELDGEDISRFVRSLDIGVEPNSLPVIRLELTVFEMESAVDETQVYLTPGTAQLLERFGWTPPKETP